MGAKFVDGFVIWPEGDSVMVSHEDTGITCLIVRHHAGKGLDITPAVLKAALEMSGKLNWSMPEECIECSYKNMECGIMCRCLLAHCFLSELKGICLKKLTIEEIRRRCDHYIPPSEKDDLESYCTAHLHESRTMECCVDSIAKLLKCEDYDFKKGPVEP